MKIKPEQLAGALAKGVPPLVVIAGPEEFLRREAFATVRRALGQLGETKGDEDGESGEELDRRSLKSPTSDDVVQLIDDLRTPSLFGGSRTIVVDPAEKWLSADGDLWQSVVANLWSDGHLILIADSIDGRTKTAKALQKGALWIQVEKPFHRPPPWKPKARPWEHALNQWIVARARSLGLALDPPTAHLLQTRTGTRLGDLASILDRLATILASRDEKKITPELIETHTPDGEESSLFEVVDTLFLGDRKNALHQVHELLRRGSIDQQGSRTTDPTALLLQCLGVALSRARQLRAWHEEKRAGGGDEEIAQRIGIARPFIPRIQQQARAMPVPAIERTIDRLIRADCDLKGGTGPSAEELFERIAAGS